MTGMRGLLTTSRTAFAEVLANRASLFVQALTMAINDAIWVLFWVLFFHEVGTLGGWDADKIIVLQACLTTAGGLTLGLLSNARRIGTMAVDGGLDAVLALPVPPLAYVLVRKVEAVNVGDFAFGVVLFLVAGDPTPERLAMFVGVVLASTVLLTSFLVLAGSLAFFIGRSESGELGFNAVLLLGAYPVDVFAGATRVLLFTVVPAVFIAAVPASLVSEFDAGRALGLVTVAVVFAVAAASTFNLGLRRYTSGSIWTRA
jgi:ABC-2 type transport system permease protein